MSISRYITPFRLRLFPRFLVFLLVLTVVPVALVGFLVVGINNDSLQFEVQRYHSKLAESLAKKFDIRLSTLETHLNLVKAAVQNPQESWENRQKLLSSLIDSSKHFGIISVVTPNGQEVLKAYDPERAPEIDANPSLISHAKIPLYKKFKETGSLESEVYRTEDRTFAKMYIPLEGPAGKSAIFVKLSLDDLCEMMAKETIGLTGFSVYVGRGGKLLSPTRAALLDPSIVTTALQGNLGAREFVDESGKGWVGASAPVLKLGGAIITQQTLREAYAESRRGKHIALGIVALTILISILAATFLTRSLVRPLISLTKVAQTVDLAAGQFPAPVQITSNDEIQELAETFNNMLEKLRGYADVQIERIIIEQKKTEAIIFSIQDGIIMTDYQGRIQLVSRTAKEVLQIPESEPVLGQPLWKFLAAPNLKTAFVELLTKPETKSIEVTLPSDPKDSIYLLSAEQVRTPNREESLGIVTVIHDITLEKELESMKEEFLHSITHDLRNPLTAIRGFIRLFISGQTGSLSDIQKKMFETMDKASLRLLNMVNDILDLARLDANRLNLHLEASQLDEIAGRVIELFQPQTRSTGITLSLDLPQGSLEPLIADPNLIERVFTNLIGNATKFTPDGGSITVKIEDSPEKVRCSVNDTGEGIPESYLEKVFDKFRQVEGNYKGGAGLGLTICKRIIEAHEGKIWVESTLGKGSSFIFIIPRTLAKPAQVKAA